MPSLTFTTLPPLMTYLGSFSRNDWVVLDWMYGVFGVVRVWIVGRCVGMIESAVWWEGDGSEEEGEVRV